MTLRNRLAGDALYTFTVRIVNAVVAACLGVLTARLLGPHGRGIYALPTVDAALVTAVFSGLTASTSFFMLRSDAGRAILRPAWICALGFVLAGTLASAAIAWGAHAFWAFPAAALSLPASAVVMIFSGYVVGTRRVRLTAIVSLMSTLATLATMIAAFLAFGPKPSSAIAAWVAGTNLLALVLAVWMIRDARRLPAGSLSIRAFGAYALRTGVVYFVSLLNYRADVYLVAVLTTPVMLGIYTLAVTGAEMLLLATQVTAVVSSPEIGSLEPQAAAALVARCVRHNVVVAGIASVALALVAPYAVALLYGARFLPMIPALRVLLVGVFALSLGSPMSTYFTIRLGKPEVALTLGALSAVICIGFTWLLVPHMGIVGAAWGSTLGYVIGQTAAIAYFGNRTKISAATMLLPRWSDLKAYLEIAQLYLLRHKGVGSDPAA